MNHTTNVIALPTAAASPVVNPKKAAGRWPKGIIANSDLVRLRRKRERTTSESRDERLRNEGRLLVRQSILKEQAGLDALVRAKEAIEDQIMGMQARLGRTAYAAPASRDQ